METKPNKWRTTGKVALWICVGLALALWGLADWPSAKWIIIGAGAAVWIQWVWNDYEERQAFHRRELDARLTRIEYSIERLSRLIAQRGTA